MMKKLLVLTAVVMLTAGSLGCQSGRWFRRGSYFPTHDPVAQCGDPCAQPTLGPACDSCGTGSEIFMPGPAT